VKARVVSFLRRTGWFRRWADRRASGRHWDDYLTRHASPARAGTNRAEWLGHPVVQERERRLRGNRSLEAWFVDEGLKGRRVERGLAIGSGTATFELYLLQSNHVMSVDCLDVSPVALKLARDLAVDAGVDARVRLTSADINTWKAPRAAYDVITFVSSLHHVSALEHVLKQCWMALKPGGVLFASEYVGPSRFAYPADHRRHAETVFDTLAPDFRESAGAFVLPDPEQVAAADPSEAVRSDAIPKCLAGQFADLETYPRFGGLLFVLWWSLNHDALFDRPEGHALVRHLCDLEEDLTRDGRLPSYFCDFIARK
jgi:SAM-dependent methyltransferase